MWKCFLGIKKTIFTQFQVFFVEILDRSGILGIGELRFAKKGPEFPGLSLFTVKMGLKEGKSTFNPYTPLVKGTIIAA